MHSPDTVEPIVPEEGGASVPESGEPPTRAAVSEAPDPPTSDAVVDIGANGANGAHGDTSPSANTHDPAPLEAAWARLQTALQREIQPEQFETWFRRAAIARLDETHLCLAVHNGFARDWLQKYYDQEIRRAAEGAFGRPLKIDLAVDPELTLPRRDHETSEGSDARGARPGGIASLSVQEKEGGSAPAIVGADLDLGSGGLLTSSDVVLNPQYKFDNFVVGPCNRFAHAACVGVGESPGRVYNPLFIHGSVGLGKTHLLQSLCHALLERDASARILYLSCETFVNHFISALENGDLQKFRGKYRNVDLLVVDDIHILANKERTQEEFFHTFNTLYNAGKQIVLSSDSPPVDIPTLQERLVSRFRWGLVTEIESPCYETRMAILKRKSRERGKNLPEEVARLLAERIDSNIRELEGAVTKLIGYASLATRPITCDLARECLREFFANTRREPSMEDIVRVVTEHFGVKLSELQSKKRSNAIAFPRQVAMVLARRLTRMSLEEIGGYFGGRDHSTVLHAVKKLNRLVEEEPPTRQLLTDLTLELQGGRRR